MHNYESFNGRVYEIPITNIGKKPKRKFVHPLNKRLNKNCMLDNYDGVK